MSSYLCIFVLLLVNLVVSGVNSQLFRAILTFGDSLVDVGNNNNKPTIVKANGLPYGRNFPGHIPTGRFSDGKLVTDFVADQLLFKAYAPAYLSPDACGDNLLIGANFASAGSGYDDNTALLTGAISLPAQIAQYKDYKSKLAKVTGSTNASKIINDALYISAFGSTDFTMYYINPLLNKASSSSQYFDYLIHIFKNFIKELYTLGARRVGVTSLPPLGCLPLVKSVFGAHNNQCVARINAGAREFNLKLNNTANHLKSLFPRLRILIFDIYTPLYNVITSPETNGFTETQRGCCGLGRIETTVLLCNQLTIGTCPNSTKYVFWDSLHPTEATNKIIAKQLVNEGLGLL